MKKQLKFMLISMLIISVLLSSVACSESTPEPEPEPDPITLTTDNFDTYFKIDFDYKINTEKHVPGKVAGFSLPTYYTGTADVEINIFPIKSIECNTITLKVEISSYKWKSKTVTFYLDDTGRASKSITMEDASLTDEVDFLFYSEETLKNSFSPKYTLISVSGSVKDK